MEVRRLSDPSEFLAAAAPLLLQDEARHNLILGIAGTLRDHPAVYPEHRLWLLEDGGTVAGAALQTPPFNVVVARPTSNDGLTTLARAIRDDGVELTGVNAALPEADVFAYAWEAIAAVRRRRRMATRIHRVTHVRPVTGVPGQPRPATEPDWQLLVSWLEAFGAEAVSEAASADVDRMIDERMVTGAGGFMLWESEGGPVSLAGWGGRTPNGMRVGPVYTPPDERRQGYGSAVTAAVSADLLASGRQFCFLYTDLANPTSNKIYMDIGYEPVCDSVVYSFRSGDVDAAST